MGNRLCGLGQPSRDGSAHAACLDHVRREPFCGGRDRSSRSAVVALDVPLHDPSARTGALDITEVDTPLSSEATDERGREDAIGRWTRVTLGCGFGDRVCGGPRSRRSGSVRTLVGNPLVGSVPVGSALVAFCLLLMDGGAGSGADLSEQLVDVLPRLADDRHRHVGLERFSLGNQDLQEHTAIEGAELHRCFVGLDLGEKVIDFHLVAFLLGPGDEGPLLHGRRKLG